MDIEIKLDSNYNIPKVIIYTNKVTEEAMEEENVVISK